MVPRAEARGDTLACLQEERPGVRRAEERCGRAPADGLRPLRRRRNGRRDGSPLCGGPAVRQLLPAVVQVEGEASRRSAKVIKRYHVPSTPCKKTERDRVLIDEKTNRNSLVRSGSATRAYRLALGIGTETWEKGGLGPVRSFWAVPVGCGRRLRENLPRLCSRHRMIGVKPA